MMKRRCNIIIILAIVISIAIGAVIYFGLKSNNPPPKPIENITISGSNLNNYTSKDLKISFNYPKDWSVDEKDYDIMVTSYKTKIGENKSPAENQIKIFIDNFNGCHKTIEENLIDPACGEGGPTVKKNKILSKEMRETKGDTFYKYVVETPNNKFTYYLLEKNDKVLQISKQPDPSQFEREFDALVNSISLF